MFLESNPREKKRERGGGGEVVEGSIEGKGRWKKKKVEERYHMRVLHGRLEMMVPTILYVFLMKEKAQTKKKYG